MPDEPDSGRLERLRVVALRTWTRSGGSLLGALAGAIAGWYGVLAGFAMGAMLDAARLRYRGGERLEPEPELADLPDTMQEDDLDSAKMLAAASLLGIPPEADRAAIKRAFWRISRASHPDGPDPDPERFMAAKRAAEALLGKAT